MSCMHYLQTHYFSGAHVEVRTISAEKPWRRRDQLKINKFSRKWLKFLTLKVSNLQIRPFADYFTMLEWRELEHEDVDDVAMHDLATMRVLRNCGFSLQCFYSLTFTSFYFLSLRGKMTGLDLRQCFRTLCMLLDI